MNLLDPHHRYMGPYEDGDAFEDTVSWPQHNKVADLAKIEMALRDACEPMTGDEETSIFQAFEDIKQDRLYDIFGDNSSEIDAYYEKTYQSEHKKDREVTLREAVQ